MAPAMSSDPAQYLCALKDDLETSQSRLGLEVDMPCVGRAEDRLVW